MIYLEHTTDRQEVYIPASYFDTEQRHLYTFALTSTVNISRPLEEILRTADFSKDFNNDFALTPEPIRTRAGLYYWFTIELPDNMDAGSYEYIFLGDDNVLSIGIAMVGDFTAETTEYNKEIEYDQYNG